MTLRQLTYFLAACEEGSFTQAANRLQVAQPSLSEQIRRLEMALGTPLFARVGRGVQPTPAGQTLRPYAERAVAAAQEGIEAIRDAGRIDGGVANFGMFRNAGYYLLGDVVKTLAGRHPSIRLRMPGQNSADVAEAVRSGALDAALVVLPIPDQGLDVEPLLEDEVLVAASRRSRLRGPIPIELFVEQSLILYDAQTGWADPTRRQLLDRAQAKGLRLEPAIEIDNLDVALDLARQGIGITVVARAAAAGSPALNGLKLMPFSEPLFDAVALIKRRGSYLPRATGEVIATVRQHFAQRASMAEA